jgi:surface polysaccharide O-acyltransferase-like enzyme
MEKASRNLSLDLLRIICMLMVVCLHFFNHGGLHDSICPGSFNWFSGNLLHAASLISVNCFVILSGYFLCTAPFKVKKFLSVWVQTVFYSVACCIIVSLSTNCFSFKELIKSGMVITLKQYWFVTAYLLLYLVSPFLNRAILAMSKKLHLLCCIVLLVVFSVMHNLVYINDFGGVNGGGSFLWFCVLYVVSAYLRIHVPSTRWGWKRPLLLYITCIVIIAGERFLAYYITPFIFGRVALTSLFYSYNSIFTTLASLSLFQCFRAITIHSNRIIQVCAPLSFGVYLIHDNRFIRPLLWNFLCPAKYDKSWLMIPYIMAGVIIIFFICLLIEFVRQKLFRLLRINNILGKTCDHIQNKIQLWLDR